MNRAWLICSRAWRYAWVAPSTLIGLSGVALALATGGSCAAVNGVLEAHGGAVSRILKHRFIAAITLGHVILGQDVYCLDVTRTHEHVHVRQYERWGPMFIPAYLLCSAVLWFQGRDAYRDNPFEVEAFGSEPHTK